MRADNTSVIVVVMEPPNPERNGELIKHTSNSSSAETIQLNSDTTSHVFQGPAFKSYSPKCKTPNQYVRRDSEIAPTPTLEIVVETSAKDQTCHTYPNKPALTRSPAKVGHPSDVQYSSSGLNNMTSIKPKLLPDTDSYCYSGGLTKGKSPKSHVAVNLNLELDNDSPPPTKLRRLSTKEPVASASVLRMENGSKTNIVAPSLPKAKWSVDIPQTEQSENLLQPCITRARAAQLSKSCCRVTRRRSASVPNENQVTKPKNLSFSCKLSLRKALKRKLSLNDSILPFRVKRSKTDSFRRVKTRIGRRRSVSSRR